MRKLLIILLLLLIPSVASAGQTTFGNTSDTGGSGGLADYVLGVRYIMPQKGIVTSISVRNGNATTGNKKMGIYANIPVAGTLGKPGVLLVADNTGVDCSSNALHFCTTTNITPTELAGGLYWIGSVQDVAAGISFTTPGTPFAVNQTAYKNPNLYSDGLPSTFNASPTFQSLDYHSYVVYYTIPGKTNITKSTIIRQSTVMR